MWRPGFVHVDAIVDHHFDSPVVMNQDPEHNASAVEITSPILFEIYYAAGGESPNVATVDATVNGVSAVAGGIIQPGFDGPRAGITAYTANRILFVLDPGELVGLSGYTVSVSYSGTDGAPCSATWSFSTADAHGPVVKSVTPTSRKTLQVVFEQSVVKSPAAVACTFPWGDEPLTETAGGRWVFSPLSYPWVKATRSGGYNLRAGMLLHVVVDGAPATVTVPWDTTDAVTTAAALDAVLGPVGAGCRARLGFAWLYSKNQSGSIEVLPGGANDLLLCEAGQKTARLAFGTTPGVYSLQVTSTQASGLVSVAAVSRALRHEDAEFVLNRAEDSLSETVTDASNYTILLDTADCRARRAPAYTPTVVRVEAVSQDTVLLYLDQPMTPGARYTLEIRDIEDTHGNPITPNPSVVPFLGHSPVVPEGRALRLYDLFPEYLRQQDANREFQFETVCAIFQEVIDQLFTDLDEYLISKNPSTAPVVVVDNLLRTYGNPFEFMELSDARRRALLELLVDLHRLRGTEAGIDAALRFFFGFETVEFIYYWGHGWVLGVHGRTEFGGTTVLSTSNLARRFSFSIAVDRELTSSERVQFRQIVERMKTAHTHLLEIRTPAAPFVPDHWQLPWSELGTNTRLHKEA